MSASPLHHSRRARGRDLTRRLRTGLVATTAGAVALAGAVVLGSPAADATTTAWTTTHNPKGRVGGFAATSQGIRVTGWAFDPDAPKTNDTVAAIVDGYKVSSVTTNVASKTLARMYGTGPTPGFDLTVPVSGRHTLCIVAGNIGSGLSTMLKCAGTPVGSSAGSSASHSPVGAVTSAGATASTVTVSGWATDHDYYAQRLGVVLYLDGAPATTVATSKTIVSPRPAGSGPSASYAISVPVGSGTHMACVWAVNIGLGANSFLGCRAVDTRGSSALAAGSPATTVNAKVLAEAKKHIGQPYVWGATGPKSFDCSGLVVYTYKKFGYLTPRTSEQQALAARLIPASHAVPGDLVFYPDTQGDVYHVGLYSSPGRTVAAIDEAEGVNWQQIWDPTWVTYGSFSHT
jgi:cell wall-associated NlpC family hydrolase